MEVVPLADVRAFVAARPPRAGTTRVLAVDGPSGSGKTTLARRLRRELGCRTIHLDAIYPGWDGLSAAPPILVAGVLRPLAEGRQAAYRRWHWGEHRWAEQHDVRADPLLVVEGVGSGALACAPYLSALVWLDAPADVRHRRGLARDGDAYAPHWHRWAAQEATLWATDRVRDRADLVVDGDPEVPHDPDTEVVARWAPPSRPAVGQGTRV